MGKRLLFGRLADRLHALYHDPDNREYKKAAKAIYEAAKSKKACPLPLAREDLLLEATFRARSKLFEYDIGRPFRVLTA